MATRTKKTEIVTREPIVIQGNHSTRTENPDGSVNFEINWAALESHVKEVLTAYDDSCKLVEKPKRGRKSKNAS
jgi:hypothetical protein